MVGVLLNDLRNPRFVDCLEGLTQVLHAQGLRTLLADGRLVANDDRYGTELALGHLLDLGHTRIAHLAGAFGAVAEIRRRSYLQVMDSRGLVDRQIVELRDGTEEAGPPAV